MSLPLAFRTRLDTIPCEMPYLAAPASKVDVWRDRLGEHAKPRIGLVWGGNPRKELRQANSVDRDRSVAFDRLEPLLEIVGCHFYSLQKGDDAVKQLRESAWRERVIDLTSKHLTGPWQKQIDWIDEQINRLWKLRGPCPGLGSALSALEDGFNGTLFALTLSASLSETDDPWEITDKIFRKNSAHRQERRSLPPCFGNAGSTSTRRPRSLRLYCGSCHGSS
jgi:hypothetical protein